MEWFRDACGLSGPLALKCQDQSRASDAATPYRLDGPFALIGRDSRSDLVLPSAQVSRRHAFLQGVGGGVFCIDLDSRTKLRWEGEDGPRVHGWLDPGREVHIGSYTIRWEGCDSRCQQPSGSPVSLTSETLEETRSALLPRAGLEVPIQIGTRESLWRMESRVALIGRSESCQVVLRDESVSRFHASLIRTTKGVWIVDLLAREGVSVNGVKVRWAWLDEGDQVRIGHFTFILRYDPPPGQITRRDVPLEAGASPEANNGVDSSRTQGKGKTLAVRSTNGSQGTLSVNKPSRTGSTPVIVEPRVSAWEPAVQVPPEQFAMWRQQMQMMELFHNDMILMVQMFVAMHREHLFSVRDELDRVQKLTGELAVLQANLAESAKQTEEEDRLPGNGRPAPSGGLSNGAAGAPPESAHSVIEAPGPGKPRRGMAPAVNLGPGATGRIDPGADLSAEPTQDRPLPGDHAGLHSHLTQRITELQRERQGYWQRILSAISK